MPTRAEDELEIMRLLSRLAQAVDDRDYDAYRDCLAEDVVCTVPDTGANETWSAVPSEAYTRRIIASVSGFAWTHHCLCNFVIVVDGERAQGKVDVVVQLQGPTDNDGNTPPTLTIGGRYDLEFGKLAVGWRITKRDMRTRYSSGKPTAVARAGAPHHD